VAHGAGLVAGSLAHGQATSKVPPGVGVGVGSLGAAMSSRPSARDLLLLAVAVTAVSAAAPLVRAADAPTLAVAFWRNLLAVPLTGALVVARDRRAVRDLGRDDWRRSVIAGLFLAAHFGTWLPSLSYTSVASSVALVSTQPVWAALIARRRGEHVDPAVWRGIVVALVGVLLLTGVDFSIEPRALFGDVLALIGGMLSACYVVVGSDVRRHTTTAVYTSICYSVAAAVLVVVCLGGRQPLSGYDGGTWLVLLALTAGPQLFGHSMFNLVVKNVGATTVSVAILFEIVGSALLAWIFFDESPPLTAVPAAALIVAGLVLVVVGHSRSRPAGADPDDLAVDPAL
jgi:drug/metabolite transporter (DMT)-like permease